MTEHKKLPKGWKRVKLTEPHIAEVDPRTSSPRNWDRNHPVSFLPMALVDEMNGIVHKFEKVPFASCKKGKRRFQNRDILFAKITPCVQNGKIAYIDELNDPVGFGSNEFFVLRAGTDLSAEYLWFFLRTHNVIKAAAASITGTSKRQRVPSTFWDSLHIPLPPLAEQKQIVDVLRQADAIRRKRAEACRLADQIILSLFLDMFGDPVTNKKNWPVEPIGNLLAPEIERVNPKKGFPEKEFTYIEIGNIDNRKFRIVEPKRILGQDAPSRARQVVRTGDILYSMTRPNLRNIAVVTEEHDGAIATTGFAILRPKRTADTAFIFEIVRGSVFTDVMTRLAEEKSLYPAVDELKIMRFPVITPPSGHREQFAANYDFLTNLIANTQQAGTEGENLFTALLSRIF